MIISPEDSVYLLHWNGRGPTGCRVARFADRSAAETYANESLPGDRTAHVVQTELDLSNRVLFPGKVLVEIFNAITENDPGVSKFENLEYARQRVVRELQKRYGTEPIHEKEEDTVNKQADTAETTKRRGRARTGEPKSGRMREGKPAGLVADFKPVREGTVRSKLVRAMNGTMTSEEIAAKIGSTAALVVSHAYCLHRDCGIGYSFDEDRRVTALFPRGKTVDDAIVAVEKK